MDNVDEWKWKLHMLLRNDDEQEIISRERKDRRDFEQLAQLADRMRLYRYFVAPFRFGYSIVLQYNLTIVYIMAAVSILELLCSVRFHCLIIDQILMTKDPKER